ncbi:MAG: N(4)-(beta-N-acetylglucosaminyl)-L-asparaginase [Pirellulales bacterium]
MIESERSTSSRRLFLAGAAGGVAGLTAMAAGDPRAVAAEPRVLPEPGKFPLKAISSDNGLEATRKAYELLATGSDTLDAAVAGVTLVEDDPNDTSVGYGGLPNENGVVQLDAAVMHGPTHKAGAVAALERIRNPAQVARLVMRETDHVLLVSAGALEFARAHGFQEQDLLTERARKIWLYWKQTHSDNDDWLPSPDEELDAEVAKFFGRPTGTIHLAAMNAAGDLSCVTTTSGLAFKLPGRVGDSPILGAGLYVDNEVGSCGSTGRGEANLLNLSSYAGVEQMRQGRSPQDAGLAVLRDVVRRSEPRLLDDQGRPKFDLKLYLLAKDGAHAGVSLWGPAKFAVTDASGTRHETCTSLYQRDEKK